jgi:transcriptional regulator with XRE-family HTH domain
MINAAQCRAARALLSLSQESLATASQIAIRTIIDFETGNRNPLKGTRVMLQRSLEAAGIEFIPQDNKGVGVRLREPTE